MDARALRDAPERLRKEAESVSPYSGTPQEKRNNAKLLLVTVNGLLNNSELVGTHRDEYAYQRAFAEAKQAEDLLEKGKGHHALNKAIKAAKFLANVIEQKNNGVKPNSKAVPRNYEAPPKVEDETGNEGVYSRELINELDLGYVKKEILAKNETEKLAALEKAAEIIEIFNVDKDTRKKEQFGFTALNSGAIIRNVYAIQTALRSFGIDVPDKQLWGNYIQTTPNGTVSDAAVRKAGKNAVDLWKKYAQTIKDKAEQAAQGNGEEAREPAPSEAIEPAPNPAAESEPTPEEAVQAIGNEAQAPAVESETPPDETATIETANEAEPSDQPVEPTETAAPDVGAETSSPVPEDGEQAARDVWASMNAPDEESEKAAPLSDSEKKKYIEYNPFAKREVPRSEIRTEIEDAYKKVSGEEFPVNDQAKFKGGYGYLCDDPDVVREAARTYKAIHSGKKDENGLYDIKPYNQAQIKLGRLCEQKLSERDAFAKRDKLVKGIKRALRYLQIEESDYYGTEQTSKTNGLQRLDVKDRISRNLDRLEKTRDVLRATELTTAIREELAGYVARTRKEFGKEEAERIAVLFGLLNPDNLLNGESLKTNEGVGEPGVWNLSYNSNEAGRPDLRQLVGIVGEFVDRLKNEPDNPVFEKTLLARVLTLHGELTEHERSKVAPLYRAMREAYLNGNSKKYLANAEKLSKMLSESPRLVNPEGEEIDEGSFDDDVPAYFRRKASNDAKTLTEEIDKLIEAKGDPNEIWDKAKRAYILATDAGLLDKDEYSYLDRSLRGSAGSFGQVASVVRDLKDALRPAFAKLAHYNFPDYAYEWDRPANTKKSEQAAQAVGSEVAPKEPESEPSAPPTETAAREVAPEPTASEPAPSEEVAQKIGNEAEQETVPAPSETEPAQEAAPSSPVG
ncbi:MAG: hypothetical protein IJM30_12515, partial [Thermoguttaceae bacterium]|nr:hypothetical protein [Thermoguttaceae bacterium]